MSKLSTSLILGFLLALICLPPLHAQTASTAPAATNASEANPAPTGQAPDEMAKKITDLVHAGRYAEAQRLTTGLLAAYPDDQRLIKAEALLEKLLSSGASETATPGTGPAVPNANAANLTGMDKVDYDALIELVRQAQQSTSLAEQKKLLLQFMEQSHLFLQKHSDATLLWQLRAASAISLDDPMTGYEAGQPLLAADSNDPDVRRLLAHLKNKGWLDKEGAKAAKYEKYGWILGTWSLSLSWSTDRGIGTGNGSNEEFSRTDSIIEGYSLTSGGVRSAREPDMRGTILDSGEIRWERYFPASEAEVYVLLNNRHFHSPKGPYSPSGWVQVISCEVGDDEKTMRIVIPSQHATASPAMPEVTLLFTRIGSTH